MGSKKELAQTVDAPVMRQVVIENPIINSPFDEPTHHLRFKLTEENRFGHLDRP